MNKAVVFPGTSLILILLGLLAAVVVAGTLTRIRLPLIGSDRTAFYALAVIGLIMCPLGMQFQRYGWLHPASIAGIVLGSLGLLVLAAVIFRLRLPLLADDRAATLALAGIMAAKIAVAALR